MVESCRFESQAGSSGEVTVVLSLVYEATLHSGKTVCVTRQAFLPGPSLGFHRSGRFFMAVYL